MYMDKSYNHPDNLENPVDERRTTLRRHLIYYLRVWDTKSDQVIGHVVDLTTEGMMLINEKPIEMNKKFQLEVRWNTPDGESIKIPMYVESRWEKKDVNPAFYNTGFKLLTPDNETLDPIRDMINDYGFQD